MSDQEWLETINIRLMREEDLYEIEWNGEFSRYRRIYKEVYRSSQSGLSIPWIAEDPENGIIGQVFLTKKTPNRSFCEFSPYLFLTSFRVKQDFRDRGLGTVLMKKSIDTARNLKIGYICLNCAQRNLRGRKFYDRFGFVVIRDDPGNWSYIDDRGEICTEIEPAWAMRAEVRNDEQQKI